MTKLLVKPLLLAALVGACAKAPAVQYAIDAPQLPAARASSKTIEVIEVSLPQYMQNDEIPVMQDDGSISSDPNILWADSPSRSISLELAESLSRLTGGVAAVEPWPLIDPAQLRLDVRVSTLLATNQGELKFAGQYLLVPDSGKRPTVKWFDISIPLPNKNGQVIAIAVGMATQQLARQIAGK